ncbi:RNA 3'-terminal phosphate cyclase [Calocera viscosa TUFC12733]|uniref:RNA 3'-terminal phosphate cyclase n=1 Tax=Calocera viscosa (strain TUFC12733) TaxID=1330018 RepID=A0A167NWH9_CALVF|nr:RNA 3'-terminal phosphate cyclase [Calocera viscosa TUFC12733]
MRSLSAYRTSCARRCSRSTIYTGRWPTFKEHFSSGATAMWTTLEPVQLDGSVLEGGGQILRNAMSYAAIFRRPLKIEKIRANRRPPGLKAQHAAGLVLLSQISQGSHLQSAVMNSQNITFHPGINTPGHYTADPRTAGSTTLLLQISLPCLLCLPPNSHSTLTLKGGTNAAQAPQVDYTQRVLLPFLNHHFGLEVQLDIKRRGYWPKGGGELYVSVPSIQGKLPAITLKDCGNVVSISGIAYVAGKLPQHLVNELCASALRCVQADNLLRGVSNTSIQILKDSDSLGSGMGIVLVATTDTGCVIAGTALGVKGKAPKEVGEEAANELARNLREGGCVDEYMQDQMIIFLALAEGRSTVRTGPLTLHTRTAIWVAEQMTSAKFTIEEEVTDKGVATNLIHCDGIGWSYTRPAEAHTEQTGT